MPKSSTRMYKGICNKARGTSQPVARLQDVRLRATFAATDSGGIEGSRLAVLETCAEGFFCSVDSWNFETDGCLLVSF